MAANNRYEDLTDKQRKFADAYFELSHGTKAAIAAGYTENSAHVTASNLLKNPKIKDYIEELHRERRERVLQKMSAMSEEALLTIYDLFKNADSEQVKLQAAKDLMDRTGFKPTDKIENKTDLNGKIEFGFVDPSLE
jgi:phage terminase small subunit